MITNKMRMLPSFASALVAHAYNNNFPVSLIVSRRDYTGMIPVTAFYEDSAMFDRLINEAKQKIKNYV